MGETLFFLALVALLAICQFMLISIMWQRFIQSLRAQEPRTALVVIRSFGPDTRAIAQALARHTRLDLNEIDELVEGSRTGPLPLPLSSRQARLLAGELRALGTVVEVEPQRVLGNLA